MVSYTSVHSAAGFVLADDVTSLLQVERSVSLHRRLALPRQAADITFRLRPMTYPASLSIGNRSVSRSFLMHKWNFPNFAGAWAQLGISASVSAITSAI